MQKRIDTHLLVAVGATIVVGFFIFLSAALGLLARGEDVSLTSLIVRQLLALSIGAGALFLCSRLHYRWWRRNTLYIFAAGAGAMLLVFIPSISIEAGGAARWIDLGIITFQPAEFFKLAIVIYFASWLAGARKRLHQFQYGLIPTSVLLALTAALLLPQPDTATFFVIASTIVVMYFIAGARWRDIGILALTGIILFAGLVFTHPYIKERITTFLNPTVDPTGASYQIQQSLIAIGSGDIFGRGFGQSVQKFNFLPEPIGDSVFAVAAEEFGFMGSVILVALFLTIGLRGLTIAARAPDYFATYLTVGLVMLIFTQSFLNIGAMLGLVPLTGTPLLFISQGGTALVFALAEVGIILGISRYRRS